MSTDDPVILNRTPFPFLVMDDSGPFSRLFEGKLLSDAETEVKRFFLIVQKDHYLLPERELFPLDNRGVEQIWQKAFSFYAGEKENVFTTLSRQIDQEGALHPFAPVFYCKSKGIFFSPPCPQCGSPLVLCTDDGLLARSGLQPYSNTLKRYLFCSACVPNGDFYVHHLEKVDSPDVKDWQTLVRDFALLVRSGKREAALPCLECQSSRICYGSGSQITMTVVPFSFYPFYMFIVEAPSVNGADFLSLISGASIEELEAQLKTKQQLGRIECLKGIHNKRLTGALLFQRGDERCFWEVLYLKLSLLSELVDAFLARETIYNDPNLSLSIDRIWIDFVTANDRLPVFWNFKLKFIDTIGAPLEPLFSPTASSFWRHYFLGLLWFRILLVNKRRNLSNIYQSLGNLGETILDPDFSFEHFLAEAKDPAFFPNSVFWDPEAYDLPVTNPLWENVLCLGLSLLREGMSPDPQWSKEKFFQHLEDLREEAKLQIFNKGPVAGEKTALQDGTDEAIRKLLIRIINKRRAESKPEKDGLDKTTILKQSDGETDDLLKETVFLSRKGAGEHSSSIGKTEMEESLPETIICPLQKSGSGSKNGALNQRSAPTEGQPCEVDFVSETILLKPVDPSVSPRSEDPGHARESTKELPGDDFLSETVVIEPSKKRKN